MRALLVLGHGIAEDDLQTERQQAMQFVLVFGVRQGQQKGVDAQQHGGQRERPLVGAAHDGHLPADLPADDAGRLQIFGQQMGFVWIGHDQAIQLVQAPDGRPDQHRRAVGQVLDAAPAGFGQRDRAVFQDEQVVAELAPGFELAFGHGFAALQEFRKRQTRRLGDHQEVVQVHRHPVGDAAADDCGDAFE